MRRLISSLCLAGLVFAGCGSKTQEPAPATEDVQKVQDLIKNAGHLETGTQAQEELVRIGKPAVPTLSKALASGTTFAQARTAEVLGRIKDPAAVDALVTSLAGDDERVRASAAYALGKIGDARALDALQKALEDENAFVAANAAQALGRIGNVRAAAALAKAMTFGDPDLRFWAYESLKKISNQDFGYDIDSWKSWAQKNG